VIVTAVVIIGLISEKLHYITSYLKWPM